MLPVIFLVLRNLTFLPYEPWKLSLEKHLNWKTRFVLVLALANRVACRMTSLSKSDTQRDGGLVPYLLFQISWLRPRTPLCIVHTLRSSLYLLWLTLWMEMDKIFSAPSELSRGTSAGRTVQACVLWVV